MKLLDFLKTITRLVGGVDSNSTSSDEEALHLMTALGGDPSSISIEDDDLDDTQKMAAFSEVLKYNSKAFSLDVFPSNWFLDLQEIQTYFHHTIAATTVVRPAITLKSFEVKAVDTMSEDVWKIPKLLPSPTDTGVVVPGVNIRGSMIRTYTPVLLGGASDPYDGDIAVIDISASILVDITELEPEAEYNFYMFYRFKCTDVNEFGNHLEGYLAIATGVPASDLVVEDGYYDFNVSITDTDLIAALDMPVLDGSGKVQADFYFIITDSAGTVTYYAPE